MCSYPPDEVDTLTQLHASLGRSSVALPLGGRERDDFSDCAANGEYYKRQNAGVNPSAQRPVLQVHEVLIQAGQFVAEEHAVLAMPPSPASRKTRVGPRLPVEYTGTKR